MTDTNQPIVIAGHVQGIGRPTKYKPEYCNDVVEWGKLGKSKAWICAELEIVDQTHRNWCDVYPDFLEAMKLAELKSQQWWEDCGQNATDGRPFNSPVWVKNVSSRFKDYREKTENTLQNADGSNIMDPIAAMMLQIDGKTRSV
jgi:hypothetical protein